MACCYIFRSMSPNKDTFSSASQNETSLCDSLISEINVTKVIESFQESPYEIIVQRSCPGVYEVLLRGKHGQKISGFALSIAGPPFQGTLSAENGSFKNTHCDPDDPNKITMIYSESHNLHINQVVTYFYPRHAHGKVEFRAKVYSDSTTSWDTFSNAINFPSSN